MNDDRERDERVDDLLQRHLDGELAPPERAELAALLAADPRARRRHDEYVALEGLLFALASGERADDADGDAPPRPVPDRAPLSARRRLAPTLAALLLFAVILAGIAPPPGRRHEEIAERIDRAAPPADLRITSLSEGHLAVAIPSQDPNVQIVWLYRTEPRPEERTPR